MEEVLLELEADDDDDEGDEGDNGNDDGGGDGDDVADVVVIVVVGIFHNAITPLRAPEARRGRVFANATHQTSSACASSTAKGERGSTRGLQM